MLSVIRSNYDRFN